MKKQIEKEKSLILEQFLKATPFDRWSESNLKKASEACGFEPDYALMLFPEGIAEFTLYFGDLMNQNMAKKFADNSYTKVSEKIIHLVELKLELYSFHKEAIRALHQYNVRPSNICAAQKQLWKTCDKIWCLAGDESTDYNHYTKRILLATVYSRTLLYWLSDDSENYADTKAFLRRKIKNVGKIGKWKASALNFFKRLRS
jgi:ubiquinone biosynthesis protein COQ9